MERDLPGWICMWNSHGEDLDFWQSDPPGNWDRKWRTSLPVSYDFSEAYNIFERFLNGNMTFKIYDYLKDSSN